MFNYYHRYHHVNHINITSQIHDIMLMLMEPHGHIRATQLNLLLYDSLPDGGVIIIQIMLLKSHHRGGRWGAGRRVEGYVFWVCALTCTYMYTSSWGLCRTHFRSEESKTRAKNPSLYGGNTLTDCNAAVGEYCILQRVLDVSDQGSERCHWFVNRHVILVCSEEWN